MALIKCKNCGQIVSDKADKCPHCGCSVSVNEALENVVVQNTQREKNNGISNKQISFVALTCLLVILFGGGIWWFLNSHEEIVKITPEFSEAVHKYDILCGFSEGMAAVRNPSNEKWGYIDTEGKEIIPCQYDDAFSFSEGLASVKGENGRYGYIDKKGKIKIDFSFGYAESFSGGIAVVTNDLTWQFPRLTFIDSKGNIIKELSNLNTRGWIDETDNLELGSFSNGVMGPCRFGNGDNDEVDWTRDGGIYIDKYGNIIENYTEDNSQKSNYEYEIVDDGIIDKAGKIVARYPASSGYRFPYEGYYDGKDLHNVVDVRNGVVLAMLHHHSDDWIGDVTIYGYVDLQGNTTFTYQDRSKIQKAEKEESERKRIAEEQRLEEERKRAEKEDIKSWIQGNWRYRAQYYGQTIEMRIGIHEDVIAVFMNGEREYVGKYTIEGDHLVYNRHNGMSDYVIIDKTNRCLKADTNNCMQRF